VTNAPDISISVARPKPTILGSSQAEPMSAPDSPTRVKRNAMRADGTPIDRDLPMSDWMEASVDDPGRIGGAWYGDRLSIPDCFDALGVGWARVSRGKSDEAAHAEAAAA